MAIVLKTYYNVSTVSNPQKVNEKESVFLGFGSQGELFYIIIMILTDTLKTPNIKIYIKSAFSVSDFCGFKIFMGESSKKILFKYSFADLQETLNVYYDKPYFILVDIFKRQIYVCFENGETTDTVLEAYFYSACLGIATCIYNEMDLVSTCVYFASLFYCHILQ